MRIIENAEGAALTGGAYGACMCKCEEVLRRGGVVSLSLFFLFSILVSLSPDSPSFASPY